MHRSQLLDAGGARLTTRSRRGLRAAGVAGAVAAALLVWMVAALVGIDLEVAMGTEPPQPVGPGGAVAASLAAAGAGWATLAVLERLTHHARTIWTVLATGVLLLSMAPTQAGVSVAATGALATMHLAVAAVLIPVLTLSAPPVGSGVSISDEQRRDG